MNDDPIPPTEPDESLAVRLLPPVFIVLAAYLAFSAWQLGAWSNDGPSAGFFPLLAASMAIICAILVWLSPGGPVSHHDADNPDVQPMDKAERHNFFIYVIALILLALGAYVLGFILTSFVVTVLIVAVGEKRNWGVALLYAAILTIGSEVVFARLLGVDLPQGLVERALSGF